MVMAIDIGLFDGPWGGFRTEDAFIVEADGADAADRRPARADRGGGVSAQRIVVVGGGSQFSDRPLRELRRLRPRPARGLDGRPARHEPRRPRDRPRLRQPARRRGRHRPALRGDRRPARRVRGRRPDPHHLPAGHARRARAGRDDPAQARPPGQRDGRDRRDVHGRARRAGAARDLRRRRGAVPGRDARRTTRTRRSTSPTWSGGSATCGSSACATATSTSRTSSAGCSASTRRVIELQVAGDQPRDVGARLHRRRRARATRCCASGSTTLDPETAAALREPPAHVEMLGIDFPYADIYKQFAGHYSLAFNVELFELYGLIPGPTLLLALPARPGRRARPPSGAPGT